MVSLDQYAECVLQKSCNKANILEKEVCEASISLMMTMSILILIDKNKFVANGNHGNLQTEINIIFTFTIKAKLQL
jgi:hypothetical protein